MMRMMMSLESEIRGKRASFREIRLAIFKIALQGNSKGKNDCDFVLFWKPFNSKPF
jgi:hypothetical protein